MKPAEIQSVKQRFSIIGTSELLERAIDIAIQVAPTDLSVLITGESGVGKENFPQIIHAYSHRKHGQYIAVNCGAIPEGTIDSELFGHEKGSFTGATADRKGYFEVADGGTIFLDEVGELPHATQVRLLRVLEAGEFIKVGSSKIQKTDVRVVAATNLNMQQAIREGRFREDLYYRLNTVPINVPPLRDRKEDVPLLFRKFSSDFGQKYRMPPIRLTDEARIMLKNYYWKGNVRQLKNITEQISVIEQQREITPQILKTYLPGDEMEQLPVLSSHPTDSKTFNSEREILYQVLFDMKRDMSELRKTVNDIINGGVVENHQTPVYHHEHATTHPITIEYKTEETTKKTSKFEHADDVEDIDDVEEYFVNEVTKSETLAQMERKMIVESLTKNKGRKRIVAKELDISERTLYRKIKEYGIEN